MAKKQWEREREKKSMGCNWSSDCKYEWVGGYQLPRIVSCVSVK